MEQSRNRNKASVQNNAKRRRQLKEDKDLKQKLPAGARNQNEFSVYEGILINRQNE